jgi:DDE superfamily endonuclease
MGFRYLLSDYFKKKEHTVVANVVGLTSIEAVVENVDKNLMSASEVVSCLSSVQVPQTSSEKQHYTILSLFDQVDIVSKCFDMSAPKIVKKYENKFHLTESSVKRWKRDFGKLISKNQREGLSRSEAIAKAKEQYVDPVKRGRPTVLNEEMHTKLLALLHAIREAGGKVSPLIVLAIGEGVVISSGMGHQLFKNGGSLVLTNEWARGIIKHHLKWSIRKVTTTRKLSEEESKDAAREMELLEEEIAKYNPKLVLEMDETLTPWNPTDNTTYAPKGSETIRILGAEDKRGNTATLTITRSGELLPLQLIWAGKTERSIPKCHWPTGFLNCYSGPSSKSNNNSTKWQNAKTMTEYILGIIKPYVESVRKHKNSDIAEYQKDDNALLIMDHHWSHVTIQCRELLQNLNIHVQFIPKKATDLFSVLDVALNRPFKQSLKTSFALFCSNEIVHQLTIEKKQAKDVSLCVRTTTIKPLIGKWICEAFDSLKKQEKTIIENGWIKVHENIQQILHINHEFF